MIGEDYELPQALNDNTCQAQNTITAPIQKKSWWQVENIYTHTRKTLPTNITNEHHILQHTHSDLPVTDPLFMYVYQDKHIEI